MPDGRTVGYADFGPADGAPVIWCHGGPGSRLEPTQVATEAAAAGFRLIGVDRPGYGLSTPWPERSIAEWVPDGLAVLDALGVERCIAVGVSTGGAYSLALAVAAPARITGVIACCALTDMRWPEGRRLADSPMTTGIWDAPDRDSAVAYAIENVGEDGSKMFEPPEGETLPLPPADLALFTDPEWLAGFAEAGAAMFAQGVVGLRRRPPRRWSRLGLLRRRRGAGADDRAARSRGLDRRRRPSVAYRVARARRPPEGRLRRVATSASRRRSPRRSRLSSDAGAQAVVWRSSTRTGGTFSDSLAVTTSSGIDISLT